MKTHCILTPFDLVFEYKFMDLVYLLYKFLAVFDDDSIAGFSTRAKYF